MTAEVKESHQVAHHDKTLVVKVRYITARKKFVDQQASPDETLAMLKPRVLEFFGLAEGSVEGGTKTYLFAVDGVLQSNLDATLGSLAHGKHELDLDLTERFEQG